MIERKTHSYHGSQGMILLVSLILLLIMTVVGIAAIDSSSLQSQMSRNSLEARTLFQANLSEIQARHDQMADVGYLEDLHVSTTSVPSSHLGVTCTGPGDALSDADFLTGTTTDQFDQSGFVVWKACKAAGEESKKTPLEGFSLTDFSHFDYEINVITAISGTSSASNQTQGMQRAAPPQS